MSLRTLITFLSRSEGRGYFKEVGVGGTLGSRDIVLYNALPNSLPRVGGIITSVIQTPLSHVNLRAIQDNVPNAYIKDPLSIDSIANLLNSYIHFKAENETFQIRSATYKGSPIGTINYVPIHRFRT